MNTLMGCNEVLEDCSINQEIITIWFYTHLKANLIGIIHSVIFPHKTLVDKAPGKPLI